MNTNIQLPQTDCDGELIQYIESIQPIGSLIATDAHGTIVAYACPHNFSGYESPHIGARLQSLLGDDATRILASTENRTEPTTCMLLKTNRPGGWMTCIAHSQSEYRIFEFEQVPTHEVTIPSVKFMNERHESVDAYLSFIARNIRLVTNFDRVMVYKFAPDWHGEVVAESLAADSHSFLGHHFPASDIPAPARELFSRIWARTISDINDPTVPLKTKPGLRLDLTRSVLRASSPIHIEYLRNMGVSSTLTLSIRCEGKLWGLIACHHFSPKRLTAEERSIYGLLAKLISSKISALMKGESMAAGQQVSMFAIELEKLLTTQGVVECVRDAKGRFLNAFDCDGFSFVEGELVVTDGHAPPISEIKKLIEHLDELSVCTISTDSVARSLGNIFPLSFAGALGFKAGSCWFIWTRKEIIRSILWAGDPHKPAEDFAKRLSPRQSFESWRENIKGTSAPWKQFEIDAAQYLQASIQRSMSGD